MKTKNKNKTLNQPRFIHFNAFHTESVGVLICDVLALLRFHSRKPLEKGCWPGEQVWVTPSMGLHTRGGRWDSRTLTGGGVWNPPSAVPGGWIKKMCGLTAS